MDYFNFLLCAMGLSNSVFFDGWNPDFDVVGDLPLEISTTILRLLDGKTLLTAALVCKKWLRIIRSDRVLRKKVRDEFRARRMVAIYYRPNREAAGEGRVFLSNVSSNVNVRLERRAVEIVAPRLGAHGKKRKFVHEVEATEKRRKEAVVSGQEKKKKKKLERIADTPRLMTRMR